MLRGAAAPDARPVLSIGAEGVRLGEPAPELIGWERIKAVEGERRSEAETFLRLGEAAWRGQLRLARGDFVMAEPVFSDLVTRMNGQRSSPALIAHEGLAWCLLAKQDLGGATGQWLAALSLRRAGVQAKPVPGPLMDHQTGLAPLLPPVVFGPAHARAMLEALDRAGTPEDPMVAWYQAEYRRAAQFELGQAAGQGPPPRDDEGTRLVSMVVRSRAGDEGERQAARQGLAGVIAANQGNWREAWARAALGRSLLRETGEAERDAGILELIHLPARFASSHPSLAAGCLGAAAGALGEMGRADEAGVLREQARLLSERGGAAAWVGIDGASGPGGQTQGAQQR